MLKVIFQPHPKGETIIKPYKKALPALKEVYFNLCAYTGRRIDPAECAEIDHFLPKCTYPKKEFTWDNFRLTTKRLNSKKWINILPLDPFDIEDGWFELNFFTFTIMANNELDDSLQANITKTIELLGLNNSNLIDSRSRFWDYYNKQKIPPEFLKELFPYIWFEAERQQLL